MEGFAPGGAPTPTEEDPVKRTRALLTTALPAALIAAVALTGCSAGGGDSSDQRCAASGKASEALKVEGDFGSEVSLTSKTPIAAKTLERSVLIEGDGDEIAAGASATANFTVFSGKSGEVVSPGSQITVTNEEGKVSEWAAQTVACSSVGDRVAAVIPAVDVLGEGGGAGYDLADSDTIVAVFDFTGLALDRAEGKSVDAPKDFPKVELGEDGSPTITIPKDEKAPTELKVATLIEGDGATVAETDTVRLHYTGVVWSSGKVFDSSWTNGAAIELPANQFVPGFTKAIVGKKVGSQIIAIIPASEGYGDETASRLSAADAIDGDVMVFVVDILGATPAAG